MARYLPMLVKAFESADLIPADDREPHVTGFLLGFLKMQVSDPLLRADVLNTEQEVRKETGLE